MPFLKDNTLSLSGKSLEYMNFEEREREKKTKSLLSSTVYTLGLFFPFMFFPHNLKYYFPEEGRSKGTFMLSFSFIQGPFLSFPRKNGASKRLVGPMFDKMFMRLEFKSYFELYRYC